MVLKVLHSQISLKGERKDTVIRIDKNIFQETVVSETRDVQNHGLEKDIPGAVTNDPFGCCSFEKKNMVICYHSSFRGQMRGKLWFRKRSSLTSKGLPWKYYGS